MDSKELNEKIEKISDGQQKFQVKGLEDTGKNIPYIGWFWRYIDFDKPIPIGKIDCEECEDNEKTFVGFMANNKWFYPERLTTSEETKKIKEMLENIVEDPDDEKLQKFFDYMQTLM